MKTLISWSSGKDCAWALHTLRKQDPAREIVLATTYDETSQRVAMHGVPMALVEAQARAFGLELWTVGLPWPCSNEIYEARMRGLLERAEKAGITEIVFADLFLEDIRGYREKKMAQFPQIKLSFPLWQLETRRLAETMMEGGLKAILACIDPKKLPREFAGREFDRDLLRDLPAGVDPCGENGEFHTFCYALPDRPPVSVQKGPCVERHGFWYCELTPKGN
jgi:diphthamide synthase (EF-2-diphthine--ammonia ligase)